MRRSQSADARGRGLRAGARLQAPAGALLRRRGHAAGRRPTRPRSTTSSAGLAREIDQRSRRGEARPPRALDRASFPARPDCSSTRDAAAEQDRPRARAARARRHRCASRHGSTRSRSTAADLAPAARQARLALSAPVRLEYSGAPLEAARGGASPSCSRCPADGARPSSAIAGPGADGVVREAAQDASSTRRSTRRFAVTAGGEIRIVPRQAGPRASTCRRPAARSSPPRSPRRTARPGSLS